MKASLMLFSEHLCRVCGFESDEKEDLFSTQTIISDCTSTLSLSEAGQMFVSCLVLEIEPNDGYPRSICLRCNTQLRMFSEFRRGALRMQDKFTDKLKTYGKSLAQEIKIDKLDEESTMVEESLMDILGNSPTPDLVENILAEDVIIDDEIENVECDEEHEEYQDDDNDRDDKDYEQLPDDDDDEVDNSDEEVAEEMDVVYLDDEHISSDSKYVSTKSKPDVSLENIRIDRSDSYFCEMCYKYVKLKVKNHVCCSELHFICRYCKRSFATKQRCEMHESRHTTERPIGCDECDKFFKNKYDLKVHSRSHSDAKNFVCQICGTGFRSSSHLTNHIQSHAKTNNFQCPHCDQKYKTKITLMRHITSMHTNKGSFECTVCLKTFGLKFRFQRHMLTHERKKRKS